MDPCHLKGERGDRLHAVLCAANFNTRWLLRMIVKKGGLLLAVNFLCLQQASVLDLSWLVTAMALVIRAENTWSSATTPQASMVKWALTRQSMLELNKTGPSL